MLNKFKNALYGSSNASHDPSSSKLDYDYRDTAIVRSAITRSTSFREDLLGKNRNNGTRIGIFPRKNQILGRSVTDDIDQRYSNTIPEDPYDSGNSSRLPKFRYSRPEFLQLKTDDEILVSADHQIRPIILPRDGSRLPWNSGYAECINAGKSLRNEDQATCYQNIIEERISEEHETNLQQYSNEDLPWTYFGVFDGHAGSAVAVAAANQLHGRIREKLHQVAGLLLSLEFGSYQSEDYDDQAKGCDGRDEKSIHDDSFRNGFDEETSNRATEKSIDEASPTNEIKLQAPNNDSSPMSLTMRRNGSQDKQTPESPGKNSHMIEICRDKITVDNIIIGTLESAFWEMDALIAEDKCNYKMPGGCTAIVGLFILGKLYVCNAGDSRAIVYKNGQVTPMSFDFTPTSERERILRLGLQRPELLGQDFTHLEFIRRPKRRDLGKHMLYKDAYMTGWSMKTITYDDLRFPLVWGEGKRSRVLATIGVTRGFGDHELRAHYGSLAIKPFLTPEPEVKVLPLEHDETLAPEDVLIIGSDGLWDVTSNEEAANIVKNSFDLFPDNEESRSKYRYITAAQDLVIHSRGHTTNWNSIWRTNDDRLASLDDIAVFVVPLKQYRDEYLEWKKIRLGQSKNEIANNQRKLSVDESIGSS